MKPMNYLILMVSIVIFSCNNDDGVCTDINVSTTSLESEYGCTNTKYQMDIDLSNDFMIIRNQADFNALVTGSCLPSIDFDTYDLVIGKQSFASGNTSIEYLLVEDCETANQNLTVTFYQNATAVAPNLTYHALIPKLDDGQVLNVEIVVN